MTTQREGTAFVEGAIGVLALGVDGGVYAPLPATAPALADFAHGQATIGATAQAVAAAPTPLKRGVHIRAHDTNDAAVYIGVTGVTTGTGYALGPGEAIFIPVSDLSLLHVAAAHAGDGVSFLGY